MTVMLTAIVAVFVVANAGSANGAWDNAPIAAMEAISLLFLTWSYFLSGDGSEVFP
jgi:hypothetical protein